MPTDSSNAHPTTPTFVPCEQINDPSLVLLFIAALKEVAEKKLHANDSSTETNVLNVDEASLNCLTHEERAFLLLARILERRKGEVTPVINRICFEEENEVGKSMTSKNGNFTSGGSSSSASAPISTATINTSNKDEALSHAYLIMLKVRHDSVLLRLARECGFPRGFPVLWFPKEKRLHAYGFYPKFENSGKGEKTVDMNSSTADSSESNDVNSSVTGSMILDKIMREDFKDQTKLNSMTENTPEISQIQFFRKYSGFLSILIAFEYQDKQFWTVTSKNNADFFPFGKRSNNSSATNVSENPEVQTHHRYKMNTSFIRVAKRLWEQKITSNNSLAKTLISQNLCICAETMAKADQIHGAAVLEDSLLVTAVGKGLELRSEKKPSVTENSNISEIKTKKNLFGSISTEAEDFLRAKLLRKNQKDQNNDSNLHIKNESQPSTESTKRSITETFVKFKNLTEVETFCKEFNLPHDPCIKIESKEKCTKFLQKLEENRDKMDEDIFGRLLREADVDAKSMHSKVLGNVLEGVVLHLNFDRQIENPPPETESDNAESIFKKIVKFKFPNYTCRTLILRELLQENPKSLISHHAYSKFEEFCKTCCSTDEGKDFWLKFFCKAALLYEELGGEKFFIKCSREKNRENVAAHIVLADRALVELKKILAATTNNTMKDAKMNVNTEDEEEESSESPGDSILHEYHAALQNAFEGTIVAVLGPVGYGKSSFADKLEKSHPNVFKHVDGDILDCDGDTVLRAGGERNDLTLWKIAEAFFVHKKIPVISTGGGVLFELGGKAGQKKLKIRDFFRDVFRVEINLVAVLPGGRQPVNLPAQIATLNSAAVNKSKKRRRSSNGQNVHVVFSSSSSASSSEDKDEESAIKDTSHEIIMGKDGPEIVESEKSPKAQNSKKAKKKANMNTTENGSISNNQVVSTDKLYQDRNSVISSVQWRIENALWTVPESENPKNFVNRIASISGKNVQFAKRLEECADKVVKYPRIVSNSATDDNSDTNVSKDDLDKALSTVIELGQKSLRTANGSEIITSSYTNSTAPKDPIPTRAFIGQTRLLVTTPSVTGNQGRCGHITLHYGLHYLNTADLRFLSENFSKREFKPLNLKGSLLSFPKKHATSLVIVYDLDSNYFGHVTVDPGPHAPKHMESLADEYVKAVRIKDTQAKNLLLSSLPHDGDGVKAHQRSLFTDYFFEDALLTENVDVEVRALFSVAKFRKNWRVDDVNAMLGDGNGNCSEVEGEVNQAHIGVF